MLYGLLQGLHPGPNERERTQRSERREHEKRRSTVILEKAYVKKKKEETNKPNVSALANNSLETGDGLGDIEFLERSRHRTRVDCIVDRH
jgi:hypothetical protein